MLKFELIQNYKHSIKILLRRKNLWFLRRTNHYTNTLQLMADFQSEIHNLSLKKEKKFSDKFSVGFSH